MELIEAFLAIIYDKTTATFALNEAHFEMFAR
jgi:hypothetical protein